MFGRKQKCKSLCFYDVDLGISLCHKQLCLIALGRTMVSPAFALSDYIKAPWGEKQRLLLYFSTCIVKGVSFFLLIVLSSMVSGTEKLIILLEIKEKTTKNTLLAMCTQNTDTAFVTTSQRAGELLNKYSQPLFLHTHTEAHTQHSSNSFGSHADCTIGGRPRKPQGEVVQEVYCEENFHESTRYLLLLLVQKSLDKNKTK